MLCRLRTIATHSIVIALFAGIALAQSPPAVTPAAPVPPQITSAKKVFISNMGVDGMASAAFMREHAENKPYDEFYAAVKAWGRYELVDTPEGADLVYEIAFTAPIVDGGHPTAFGPQFNLSVVDAHTHFRLWTLLAPVEGAFRRVTWDKNFANGLNTLMRDLKKLSTRPEAAPAGESK